MIWTFATPVAVMALLALQADRRPAHERLNLAYASAATLKGSLQSPRNMVFDAVRVTDAGATCMEYRVGGDDASRARAVVLGPDVARSDGRDGKFARQWNRQCLGLAHDVTRDVDRFF